jgi:hypothetical protein
MKPELKQLDLFSQDFPQDLPGVSASPEEKQVPVQRKEASPSGTELKSIQCTRCGEWLCDALAGAKAYCPRCRVWSGSS